MPSTIIRVDSELAAEGPLEVWSQGPCGSVIVRGDQVSTEKDCHSKARRRFVLSEHSRLPNRDTDQNSKTVETEWHYDGVWDSQSMMCECNLTFDCPSQMGGSVHKGWTVAPDQTERYFCWAGEPLSAPDEMANSRRLPAMTYHQSDDTVEALKKSFIDAHYAEVVVEEDQSLTRDEILTESSIPCVKCGDFLENSSRRPSVVSWGPHRSLIHQECVEDMEHLIRDADMDRTRKWTSDLATLGGRAPFGL